MSEHSLGVVEPEEILIRLLIAPQHMKGKRKPKVGALTDAERNGLSLFRKRNVKPDEILREATQLVERARKAMGKQAPKVGVFGALEIKCIDIRECFAESEAVPSYCVYDTALKELQCHAEAFQQLDGASEGLIEERRKALFDRLESTFVPVEKFMDGLLIHLAPQV